MRVLGARSHAIRGERSIFMAASFDAGVSFLEDGCDIIGR